MKTHWKQSFNPEFVGAFTFQPGEVSRIVRIDFVNPCVAITGTGGKTEDKPVVYFDGDDLPMILNRTNSKAISKAVGSPFFEDWAGKHIELYVEKVKAFGDVVDAIRVKTIAPELKKPSIDEKRFAKMLESIKAGKYTAEKAKNQFALTPDQIKKLQ